MVKNLTLLLAAVLSLALAAAAAGATPGVSATEIVIGGTVPLSGEAAAAANVAKGADAYFKYVNAHGGVHGRKITYKYLDDAYDPNQTVQDVRQLVQQDNAFAIFGAIGTSNNLSIRDFLNTAQVPQLFANAGATTFGADYAKYPWTIGYIPTYKAEGEIYARYILKNLPKAKIGVLYQNDDYGNDLLGGFRKALGARQSLIVSTQSYEPTSTDVQSQIAALKGSGANVLCIFAFGKFSIQAFNYAGQLGWKPQIFVNDVSAAAPLMQLAPAKTAEGAVSIVYLKDPASPKWAKDPGISLFRQILKRYGPGISPKDGYAIAGMASAFTLVDALKKAGKNLTRAGVMKAATSLNEANNPFLLPGIVIKTSAKYRFPVSQVQLQRWTKGHWQLIGGLVSARP
ncbi:MAG TPA: ABC transporter substrate-binding protein [Gaiellaceae bacterium]